jgi:hypothetical protein
VIILIYRGPVERQTSVSLAPSFLSRYLSIQPAWDDYTESNLSAYKSTEKLSCFISHLIEKQTIDHAASEEGNPALCKALSVNNQPQDGSHQSVSIFSHP